MKLKNSLYRIIQTDSDNNRVRLHLVPDSMIYQAHFPGHPVTPGVCIIGMVTEMLEDLIGKRVLLTGIANAKFLSVINPLETPVIDILYNKIDINDNERTVRIQAVAKYNDITYSKLSITYRLA